MAVLESFSHASAMREYGGPVVVGLLGSSGNILLLVVVLLLLLLFDIFFLTCRHLSLGELYF